MDWKVWAAWLVFFGILSAVYPRDVHYDVAHYHLVNGWSIWEGRLGRDLAPAGMHSFLNPLHSAFIWWFVDHLPGPLVNGLLGLVQGLMLPVLYALTARIASRMGADCDRTVIALVALAGFLTQPNWMMLATLRHDHWGALAFLAAMAVIVGKDGRAVPYRTLGGFALLLGLLLGMKPTNAVYAAGFAAMVLVAVPGVQTRLKAVLVCGVTGLAGMLLTGGAWHYRLWAEFGNPLYPMMTQVPDEHEGGTHGFRDSRFLPDGLLDGGAATGHPGIQQRCHP